MALNAPVFTDSVNQQFFIEAQTGARQPVSYLDRFPDTLYSRGIDSILVTFLYALLGPVGAGYLREQYLEARLAIEDAGLSTVNLDALYTNPFAFARLADETYTTDAIASLLSSDNRAQILASDASFRNRAIDFLKGIRAGGTRKGFELVAKSGLNRPVEVIENYRSLYDQFSDIPLGLPYMGTTTNLNEVIVQPRQDSPRSALQSLVLIGKPTSGWFTLTAPLGQTYITIQVTTTSGSNLITVPDSSQIVPGTYITIAGSPFIYAQVGAIIGPTQISLVYPLTSLNMGLAYPMPNSNTFTAYVGYAETVPIPYNATTGTIQAALQALRVINGNNVSVTGGPLPDRPVFIEFTNTLSDQPIPALQPNVTPDALLANGIGPPSSVAPLVSQMTDVVGSILNIGSDVTVDVVGTSADSQTTAIAPADEHAMQTALDQIRPQTVFVTTKLAPGVTQRISPTTVFAGSHGVEIVRYETGNAQVPWPMRDQTHWVENGQEREALRPAKYNEQHYQCFHNIVTINAYTEAALDDPNYSNPDPNHPLWVTYWNTMRGSFSPAQQALYPFLTQTSPDTQYSTSDAAAPTPDPLIITHRVNGTGIINATYPVDYLSLPGVPQISSSSFWASAERVPDQLGNPSIDYLEIDLGTVQAVNYIYFEATNKPYTISVDYDTLDQTPSRQFVPVTFSDLTQGSSITSLVYNATATNPWTVVEIHCENQLGQMIFTRYIRIGFQRDPAHSPFAPVIGSPIPYSIEVRNLRLGRNLNNIPSVKSNTISVQGTPTPPVSPTLMLTPGILIS